MECEQTPADSRTLRGRVITRGCVTGDVQIKECYSMRLFDLMPVFFYLLRIASDGKAHAYTGIPGMTARNPAFQRF